VEYVSAYEFQGFVLGEGRLVIVLGQKRNPFNRWLLKTKFDY
jgi:hypothetical protein